MCPPGFDCSSKTVNIDAAKWLMTNKATVFKYSVAGLTQTCPTGYTCYLDSIIPRKIISTIAETANGGAPQYSAAKSAGTAIDGTTACGIGYFSALGDKPRFANYATGTSLTTSGCRICPPGHYCNIAKLERPIPCLVNQYQDLSGQSSCKSCPTGYYTNATGQAFCFPCPAGFECSKGVPMACGVGTYSFAGDGVCSPCTAGFVCFQGSDKPDPREFECPKGTHLIMNFRILLHCGDY